MRDAETRPFKSAVAQPDFAVDKSQWECIKENIGVWQGSFMQFSPEGELVKDTPSVLKLEETEPDQTMVLTLERMPADEPKKVNNLTFTYPGPAPYTYFFRCGAFSQGSSQWSSFGQFVTEFSLKVCDLDLLLFLSVPEETNDRNLMLLHYQGNRTRLPLP